MLRGVLRHSRMASKQITYDKLCAGCLYRTRLVSHPSRIAKSKPPTSKPPVSMFPKLSRTPVNFACSMLHCWGHRKNTVQWLATLIACACRAAPCNKFTKPQLGPSPSLLLLASCLVLTPTLPVAWKTGRRGLGNHVSLAAQTGWLPSVA